MINHYLRICLLMLLGISSHVYAGSLCVENKSNEAQYLEITYTISDPLEGDISQKVSLWVPGGEKSEFGVAQGIPIYANMARIKVGKHEKYLDGTAVDHWEVSLDEHKLSTKKQ